MPRVQITVARVVGWCFALLIGMALVFATSMRPPWPLNVTPRVAATETPSVWDAEARTLNGAVSQIVCNVNERGCSPAAPSVDTRQIALPPYCPADVPTNGYTAHNGVETTTSSADPSTIASNVQPAAPSEAIAATPSEPPSSSVKVALLRNADVVTRINTTQKVIAFTFDFDMTPTMLDRLRTGRVKAWYDPEVLKVLETERVPSTIFVAGLAAVAYPDLLYSLAQNPLYEIGNHSNRHFAFAPRCYTLPSIADREDKDEVDAAQQNIRKAAEVTPQYFRFPGGCYESKDVEIITQMGLTIVQWDVVSSDAFNPNWAVIMRRVIAQARPGSIVLFHLGGPNAPQTANALKVLIPFFKEQGYTFVTISQLLQLQS